MSHYRVGVEMLSVDENSYSYINYGHQHFDDENIELAEEHFQLEQYCQNQLSMPPYGADDNDGDNYDKNENFALVMENYEISSNSNYQPYFASQANFQLERDYNNGDDDNYQDEDEYFISVMENNEGLSSSSRQSNSPNSSNSNQPYLESQQEFIFYQSDVNSSLHVGEDYEDDKYDVDCEIEYGSITITTEIPPSPGHQSNYQPYLEPQPTCQPELNLQPRQQLNLQPNFQLQPDFQPQPNFQPRQHSEHQSEPSRPAVNSSPYVVQFRNDDSRNHNIPPSRRRQSDCQRHLKPQPNLQPRQHRSNPGPQSNFQLWEHLQHQPSAAPKPAVNSAPRVKQFTVTTSRTCPSCHRETLKPRFTLKGWLYAIGCFPCGIICCFDMRKKKCTRCGYSKS